VNGVKSCVATFFDLEAGGSVGSWQKRKLGSEEEKKRRREEERKRKRLERENGVSSAGYRLSHPG
jgi:hypothetical protein